MTDNNKKFEQEAKAFFVNPKNSNKNTCYITSDGNVFSADHYAQDWKKKLKDRTVEVYHRHGSASKIVEKLKEVLSGGNIEPVLGNGSSEADRDALVKEYIELFDTKPHHKWSDEKVKALIDEKKAESNDPEGSDNVEGNEETTLPNE
ncbi:hypothetical protein [Sphingobacterium daejeonense]|uniref:hypothetical protein n=1 Tax=Sphingobacterium daejeonense TaxID=371142 RepID=UPI0010C32C84|nr:hypothetical protein [Sphingobacterium daejeonense]VTP94876.1 Uncharacterised protein [Sphingobacterium daejeonense]